MKHPLKPVADHLASKGRNGDDSLVHVSRDELRGLASLHPKGKLPINPDTGHPEAFDLGGMLASLMGGGAGFFVGGPMGAAIGSGLGTAAYTGDLGQGIASGLLSFGLGSAIGGLGGAGGEVASDALKGWGGAAAGEAASAGAGEAGSLLAPEFAQSAYQGMGSALNVPAPSAGGFMDGITNGLTDKASGYLDTLGRAGSNLTNPEALWDTFGKNAIKTTLPIGLGAYGMFGGFDEGGQGQMPQQQTYGPATTQGTGRRYVPSPQGYRPGFDPEWRYFQGPGFKDGGGIGEALREGKKEEEPRITFDENGNMVMNVRGAEEYNEYYDDLKRENPPTYAPQSPYERRTPEVRFADGGAISGPGGGLDDAIPAIIDGRHPAQLSSGEYVVPAHAVSALGNGSTEHGIREMDRMVSKVMKHKYGTTNRKPRPLKAEKMMPV